MTTFHEFSLDTISGQAKRLADFSGQTVLVVNVASKCGFTPQYAGLEALYRAYRERGFSVLGVPCNQFGGQEPGTEAEIGAFCSLTYDVTFPLSSKVEVNGPNRHPLYAFLTEAPTAPDGPGDVVWNFAKFLIDRDGAVRARFSPQVAPEAAELLAAIEAALA